MNLKDLTFKPTKLHPVRGNTPAGTAPITHIPESSALNSSVPVYSGSRAVDLDYDKLLRNRCVCFFHEAPEVSYYKLLRTKIMQQCKANKWNTIMITSAVPGEGKTLTAINLAVTFAKAHDQTVLLVDCDLRRQTVHQYLGVTSHTGLTDYLKKSTPLQDLIIWPKVEKFSFISGGETVYDSAELISSPKMAELVAEMKTRYSDRYVFFDTPPLLAGADTLAFSPMVDCIIMVVHSQTSLDELKMAFDLVPKEKFLGFVLNRTESSQYDYYHKYNYYGYGYKKSDMKIKLLEKKIGFSLPDLNFRKFFKKK